MVREVAEGRRSGLSACFYTAASRGACSQPGAAQAAGLPSHGVASQYQRPRFGICRTSLLEGTPSPTQSTAQAEDNAGVPAALHYFLHMLAESLRPRYLLYQLQQGLIHRAGLLVPPLQNIGRAGTELGGGPLCFHRWGGGR